MDKYSFNEWKDKRKEIESNKKMIDSKWNLEQFIFLGEKKAQLKNDDESLFSNHNFIKSFIFDEN